MGRAGTATLAALGLLGVSAIAEDSSHGPLIDRYAAACVALSATECQIRRPVPPEDAARLRCLFDQLDRRAGPGTAEAHVVWAERYAATGTEPDQGFPSGLGEQRVLVAALIACRAPR